MGLWSTMPLYPVVPEAIGSSLQIPLLPPNLLKDNSTKFYRSYWLCSMTHELVASYVAYIKVLYTMKGFYKQKWAGQGKIRLPYLSLRGWKGSLRQITSLELTRKFQTEQFRLYSWGRLRLQLGCVLSLDPWHGLTQVIPFEVHFFFPTPTVSVLLCSALLRSCCFTPWVFIARYIDLSYDTEHFLCVLMLLVLVTTNILCYNLYALFCFILLISFYIPNLFYPHFAG